jgi:lysophospholipase L1-like esterase
MPAPDDAVHILFVGGSTTECLNLDDTETWPHLVMATLNESRTEPRVWAGNVGMSGTTTRNHLQFLERDSLVRQMDCVVVQAGVNDISQALYRSNYQADPRLLPKPIWFRSRIYAMYLGYRVRAGQQKLGRVDAKGPGARFYIGLRKRRHDAAITSEAPDLSADLEGYESRVRRMIDACRKRDIAIVFTSQPVLWDAGLGEAERELLWFGSLRDGSYLSVEALREAMDAYNEIVRRVCADEGIPFVDLGSMNGRPEYFFDDCHFSEAGALEVARRVAERLATEQ